MSAGDVLGSVDLAGCPATVFEQANRARTVIVVVGGLSVRLNVDADQAAELARLLTFDAPGDEGADR